MFIIKIDKEKIRIQRFKEILIKKNLNVKYNFKKDIFVNNLHKRDL